MFPAHGMHVYKRKFISKSSTRAFQARYYIVIFFAGFVAYKETKKFLINIHHQCNGYGDGFLVF